MFSWTLKLPVKKADKFGSNNTFPSCICSDPGRGFLGSMPIGVIRSSLVRGSARERAKSANAKGALETKSNKGHLFRARSCFSEPQPCSASGLGKGSVHRSPQKRSPPLVPCMSHVCLGIFEPKTHTQLPSNPFWLDHS